MFLSRIQIKNFRNFGSLDLSLNDHAVIVGENRVGKSNFLLALRLVLDSSLPDTTRQLKLTDIWDKCADEEPQVEVHLDFSGFQADPNLTALLTDYRLPADHNIARLSYIYKKRADVEGAPSSEADYEFKIFGAGDEARSVSSYLRRKICLVLLHALRDAESELAVWRTSPLRPLLDDAISRIPNRDIDTIAVSVETAVARITALEPIRDLEATLKEKIAGFAGPSQDIQAKLGLAPTDPLRLFRSVRLLIDDGKRTITEASLGSANLTLLTLKLAEFAWLREKNDHNFTILCIEEPEAHLHPHLQRSVFKKLFSEVENQPLSLFLTTHSPNLVSVTPLKSLVVLKDEGDSGTKAYSLARINLTALEMEDLQRYLDVSRAEMLFSRGIIFVEGDAEEALLPAFAKALNISLDDLGFSICNVRGINFEPYVRFAHALAIPFVVLTDWDPQTGTAPLGVNRLIGIMDSMRAIKGTPLLTDAEKAALIANEADLRRTAQAVGIFTNGNTLEIEVVATAGLTAPLLNILEAEGFGRVRQGRIDSWRAGTAIDSEQLMAMIADIGKGRLATRLTEAGVDLPPPTYIRAALEHLNQNGG
jgi:putative ATP-dependent endonuclease of OLD family